MVGHKIVDSAEDCDLVVINTCTVTSAAAADSRRLTRQAHRQNPEAQIVLTGCWSTLEAEQAMQLPGVIQVINNADKDHLVLQILDVDEKLNLEPNIRYPVRGSRARTRAFIKTQDGCDNSCTFCITTIARGRSKSVPPDQVIQEIRAAEAAGLKEAVLTGVQLTAYGKDREDVKSLKSLVENILNQTEIPRLRLSSLEPWEINADFFELWSNSRLCRQLHLPLQSGSTKTLRRMGRPIMPSGYAQLISDARKAIPSIAVTTDIIVGFPGETDEEFEESLSFIDRMSFARAHVFSYSPRPGTPAYQLPNRIPKIITQERSRLVRDRVSASSLLFKQGFLDKELIVLWENASYIDDEGWEMKGLTDNYLQVRALAEDNLWNKLSLVKVSVIEGDVLIAEIRT
jgi:threonylcarbamoyladenosine tRNA methylthiotransferase MtaB